jgi:stalled ribosome alternative rescue factor ArfA
MRFKNILLKELFKRKYRNRIKQNKKGKGSFKRLNKIKVQE